MRSFATYFLSIFLLSACVTEFNAEKVLSEKKYTTYLNALAPFCIKKPDHIPYDMRFSEINTSFYTMVMEKTEASMPYYFRNDTAQFFFYHYKDLSSLYEHYRGLGGYFRADEKDSIVFLNILYHTPRLTKEEMAERGRELFEEMIGEGNVDQYIGNRKYIHTPNADFYYNTKTNRWEYTENSSWKFLEEAREAASASDSAR